MMQVRILFFATLRDLTNTREYLCDFKSSIVTIKSLRAAMIEHFPEARANLEVALTALNEEYVFDDAVVKDGDTVAFFPPVSGGSSDKPAAPEVFLLPTEPLDHDAILAAITTSETGAVCLFSGLVRGITQKEGHLPQTEYLEYEAYEDMALATMKQVASEIREQFPRVIGIAIVQRLGKLEVGQNTVLIACSSPHRDDGCFEAARYGIDRLKEIVPVWKKEVSSESAHWIEGEYHPDEAKRKQ